MKFSLFYKDYDFKVNFSAMREFKQETGRGLWSSIQGVLVAARKSDDVWEQLFNIGKHIDELDGAMLLWIIAKQCNNTLQLSEIEDAVIRCGWKPVDSSDKRAQPYTHVLYSIVLQLDQQYEREAIKAKKDLCDSSGSSD